MNEAFFPRLHGVKLLATLEELLAALVRRPSYAPAVLSCGIRRRDFPDEALRVAFDVVTTKTAPQILQIVADPAGDPTIKRLHRKVVDRDSRQVLTLARTIVASVSRAERNGAGHEQAADDGDDDAQDIRANGSGNAKITATENEPMETTVPGVDRQEPPQQQDGIEDEVETTELPAPTAHRFDHLRPDDQPGRVSEPEDRAPTEADEEPYAAAPPPPCARDVLDVRTLSQVRKRNGKAGDPAVAATAAALPPSPGIVVQRDVLDVATPPAGQEPRQHEVRKRDGIQAEAKPDTPMSDTGISEIGWIAVPRQVFSDAFFRQQSFTEREAWLWLIADAAWRPRQRRIDNHVRDLGRGQLAVSIRFLATAWGWEQTKVHRFLKRLKTATRIETDTATGITVITICNYDDFQHSQSDFATSEGPPDATAPQQHRNSTATNYKKRTTEQLKNSSIRVPRARRHGDEDQGSRKQADFRGRRQGKQEPLSKSQHDALGKLVRETVRKNYTWETAESAILGAFAEVNRIAPARQVRWEPKDIDICLVDEWMKRGEDPTQCVCAVLDALVKKLSDDPLVSLNYVEQRLEALYARRQDDGAGA